MEERQLQEFLRGESIPFMTDYLMKYDTYFMRGGRASHFISPLNLEQLISLVNFLKQKGMLYSILGFTSNVFLLNQVRYGIIISTRNLNKVEVVDGYIHVESGYSLERLVRVALLNGSEGFEGLEGIPGSVGGAVLMNAGAYGYCISDNLKEVVCLNEDGKVVSLTKEDCQFGFRTSLFKKSKLIVLKVKFRTSLGEKELISRRMERFHIARHSYQEFSFPNIGSLFSIPSGGLYDRAFKTSLRFRIIFLFKKYLFLNPLMKFLKRKSPDKVAFNLLLEKFLFKEGLSGRKENVILSRKGANILVNSGGESDTELIRHISLLKKLLGCDVSIENEVLIDNVSFVEDSFRKDFSEIKSHVKSWS